MRSLSSRKALQDVPEPRQVEKLLRPRKLKNAAIDELNPLIYAEIRFTMPKYKKKHKQLLNPLGK